MNLTGYFDVIVSIAIIAIFYAIAVILVSFAYLSIKLIF